MASDLDGGAKLTSLHKKKMLSPKTSGFLPKFWFKPSQWAGRSSLAGCPFDLNPGRQKVRVKAVKATIDVPIQHTGVWCNSLQSITFLNLCRILSIKCRKTPFRKPFESTQVHTLSKMPPEGSLCFPACRWKQSREKSDVDGKHSPVFQRTSWPFKHGIKNKLVSVHLLYWLLYPTFPCSSLHTMCLHWKHWRCSNRSQDHSETRQSKLRCQSVATSNVRSHPMQIGKYLSNRRVVRYFVWYVSHLYIDVAWSLALNPGSRFGTPPWLKNCAWIYLDLCLPIDADVFPN